MDENKQITNLGRGTRRGEYCAGGVPAEVVLFWKPATLAILARREASSSLLHEPPLLGAAPPTHLMEWGSLHLNCYGPNECGCVTKSMPNPLREGGPPCALGLRGRAPTEENPKRGRRSDGPPRPQGSGPRRGTTQRCRRTDGIYNVSEHRVMRIFFKSLGSITTIIS